MRGAWLARVDFNLARGNRFNVRYNGSTNQALNSDGVGGVIIPTTNRSLETNGTEEDSMQTAVGQFTSVPSSEFLFELRGQYSREDRPRSANALKPLVDLSLGEFGTRSFRPTTQYDWRGQAVGKRDVAGRRATASRRASTTTTSSSTRRSASTRTAATSSSDPTSKPRWTSSAAAAPSRTGSTRRRCSTCSRSAT